MNALLDAVRAGSPCAVRLVRQYSTSLSSVISRVRTGGNDRRLAIIRSDLEDAGPGSGSGARNRRDGRTRSGGQQHHGGANGLAGKHNNNNNSPFRPHHPENHRRKYALFGTLVDGRFGAVMADLGPWTPEHRTYRAFGLHSQGEVDRQAKLFRANLAQALRRAAADGRVNRNDNPLFWSLRNAFVQGDAAGLTQEIQYAFQTFVLRHRLPPAVTALQEAIADFRFPYEWYPATRTMQRTVHLHVGPTNSGKTYRALLALERARTGIYAGPLRLLAHEVYTRFLAKGKPCALITGEEQRFPTVAPQGGEVATTTTSTATTTSSAAAGVADNYFQSCTVEMTPLNTRVDVAVIDEIQMLADPDRGWAWTQAFLGVQAREVHLCGEARAVDLVRALCARTGDACVVHRYERLSALQTAGESLRGDFGNLRKGDAVVSFSRVGLHTLKAGIESMTGRRCAIVYGSLPPETRAQQAALFNDPTNDYDFLVASDAIGMGLNLEIKRVIFETATKHDGLRFRQLTVPEIKQIGGRAGRFRTAPQAVSSTAGGSADRTAAAETTASAPQKTLEEATTTTTTTTTTTPTAAASKTGLPGIVATLEDEDLGAVQAAFETEAEPLTWAGIQPPTFAVERFARYFPTDTPFSFILLRLRALAKVGGRFKLCTPKESLAVADIIQPFPLSIHDRCVFLAAPVALRDPGQREVLAALARCVARMQSGALLDIPEIDLEVLDVRREDVGPTGDGDGGKSGGSSGSGSGDGGAAAGRRAARSLYLARLEALHKAITLYLWLSYRYVGVFTSQALAFHVKGLVEDKITEYLEALTFVPERRRQRAEALRKLAAKSKQAGRRRISEALGGDAASAIETATVDATLGDVPLGEEAGLGRVATQGGQ
ncbi:mitochondrial ATP-dependent RNA helicase [Niveomyces insectorum RCEF 264]|uniref:RNA helicase n=1 Tax=Niveomyces insectorum RCEF 264 TaxID=1081102 RepID=A0A167VGF7_9HYPO|nr:mitochondrial ATP-dependent RNA helicase [Niveomyces insectorum RCEF 264]